MRSERATIALRIGFSAAAAVLVLVGASLNSGGRAGGAAIWALVAGGLAFGSGVLYARWKLVLPLGAAALVLTLAIAAFNPVQSDLLIQVGGLVLLAIGGVVGGI